MSSSDRDLVLGITPGHEPNANLVVAVERAGYLGVLDLGSDRGAARSAVERVRQRLGRRPFGVRLGGGWAVEAADLPPEVDTILLDPVLFTGTWPRGTARVLAEVTSPGEADQALRHGADGLVARGFESGGRIGSLSTFVLVQALVAEFGFPVWAMGGIGPRTAAAAVAGGARGVVLDAQLALVAEAELAAPVAAAIAAMDGSETRVSGGFRFYTRPGLPRLEPAPGRLGARDLQQQLLPIGQDGALAAPLAARYRTAGGVTQAIGAAITEQIELAARIEPLAGAVPVQGPMTRVSDRAEFAEAVAGAGGLPFLALALMPGDQAEALLAATAGRLRDRSWGVGILGFAPAAVRAAQLAAILRARPPYALIAGGRPSQAEALQQAGIETFLHVPSPGLLDQFLAGGARRFVFEGAECGGHIGPRGSFALWEAQLARLLEQPDLTGVRAWFAGGVHDERSAAMVAAMAAPLAARGAQVSVLMGTAYLFTREVAATGAVVPLYQRTALDCAGTALLETLPGHVIRCADTPYVQAFAAAKERLAAAGASPQEAWAELEQLSLGRLRVAAKGVRRDGDALVAVDPLTARADGMFMLGQVATLRSQVTTIAALHQQVTTGATAFLAARAAKLRETAGSRLRSQPQPQPLDVAIVGMACVYPGADGLGRFWANVVAGADAIGDVPAQRWQPERYPDLPARGGFVPPVPFDALAYGIPPAALASIEPVQLLALEVAARALADAGYSTRPFDRSRASVIVGAEPGSDLSAAYGLRSALPGYTGRLPAELDQHLPALTEDSFPGVLGNVIAGRIANRLDLGGVNYVVDAACASSLAALDLACKELAAGTSDLVLCGGADTHNGVHDYEMFASVHALSAHGRCATFDAQADGIALGEGVACVVLKRLADAERDGDRVYAVVKGVGGSSDGRSLGLTAPRPEGQRLALERAYAMAGVSPAEVGLIEAHGTGTVAGDRAELATLTAVFAASGAAPGGCAVGSVKSQIGHTKCAAGLAGLIKVASALHTGTRPGTIHLTAPNDGWDPAASPFAFTGAAARPWPAPPGRRHAGVSAFGFGGTNFHAVLSGYDGADEPRHGLSDWPAELIALRGDPAEAAAWLAELAAANDAAGRPWRLAELAATAAARPGPLRAAFVAADLDDLARRLAAPLPSAALPPPAPGDRPGRLAFLFPGQGSQRPGLAADLLIAFPRLQRLLRLADPACAAAMFPPAAFSRADRDRQAAAITDTRMAQPALGVASLVLWELLTAVGVRPDMAAGHSYGELTALCAAGVYDEAELLALSEIRASAILAAVGDDPGAMAAVSADAPAVAALLDRTGLDRAGTVIANHNAPDQVVISGPTEAVEAAIAALGAAGLPARRLLAACAFHSPLVAGAATTMAQALAGWRLAAPRYPVYANSTAAPYPDAPDDVRRLLAAQVADPVRFADQIEAMYAAGARTFVEVGPGRVLTGLVGRVLGDRPHTVVAGDVPGENGLRRFLIALAELVTAGVPVDPGPLFSGRAEPVTEAPPRPGWTVDGHLVRTADGQPVAHGLRPATAAPRLSLGHPAAATATADRDAVVADFLRTTRELVAAQREVVLGYLGAPFTAPPAPVPLASSVAEVPFSPERTVAPTGQLAPAPPAAPGETHVPATPLGRAEIAAAVVSVIGARTGYPLDMLGADLDLEADLSVDSIKRTEIIAALAQQLGLASAGAALDEPVIEELSRIKTISGITDWLAGHLGGAEAGPALADPLTGEPRAVRRGARPRRFLVEAVELPPAGRARVSQAPAARPTVDEPGGAGQQEPETQADTAPASGPLTGSGRFVLVEDGRGVALELADALEQRGATAVITAAPSADELAGADALVHLGALRPGGGPMLPGAFGVIRDALAAGARAVLVATVGGGMFGDGRSGQERFGQLGARHDGSGHNGLGHDESGDGAPARGALAGIAGNRDDEPCDLGLRGLIRTVAAEYPGVLARAVDVEPKDSPRDIAAQLLAELDDPRGPAVVGYRAGRRTGLRLVARPLPAAALSSALGPSAALASATAAAATAAGLGLDAGSVVLLTGGARGITASVALALARSTGCHIELIGRSPVPGPADPELDAADPAALRRLLISRAAAALGGPGAADPAAADPVSPRQIEAAAQRLLRERQIRATLAELRESAGSVRYHSADVRDAAAVGAVLADVYGRFGRLDGVIHGAGVLEDRLIAQKAADSFDRVYATKVDGARALAAGLRGRLRFLVLFGSVAGVFGNRGQADYAAANDALDALARHWSGGPAARVVAVDWGPWAGCGMVTPELEREYARRGVTLIEPDEGVACLLAELADPSGPAQVVYACDEAVGD